LAFLFNRLQFRIRYEIQDLALSISPPRHPGQCFPFFRMAAKQTLQFIPHGAMSLIVVLRSSGIMRKGIHDPENRYIRNCVSIVHPVPCNIVLGE
jgi:hypothetical protein